jgi:cysteine synthase B
MQDNRFMPTYRTLEDVIGGTPLVKLQRLPGDGNRQRGNVLLGKLEGNNPAGSVKDRPAISMIARAEERGEIRPGDTLIEATSGNTGIALAMAAAIRGYRMLLIMPEDLSIERAQTMKAFGAELVLTPKSGGMEYARDLALQMQSDGRGRVLDQFANADNPRVHYETTGPEIWRDTDGEVTHFVSAMGTTGTITGVSRFLKERNPAVRIVGAQPAEGSRIPGIRKWPEAYLPKIYDATHVDEIVLVSQAQAEDMARRLAREEGLFAGISATAATATCRRASFRHEPLPLLPAVRDAAHADRADRGRRPDDAAALSGLRLHALEQPDAGACGGRRMHRP